MGVKQNYRMIHASQDEIVTRSLPIPPRVLIEDDFQDYVRRLHETDDFSSWDAKMGKAVRHMGKIDSLEPMEEVQREVFNRKQPLGWEWLSKPVGLAMTAAVAIIALYVGIGL